MPSRKPHEPLTLQPVLLTHAQLAWLRELSRTRSVLAGKHVGISLIVREIVAEWLAMQGGACTNTR